MMCFDSTFGQALPRQADAWLCGRGRLLRFVIGNKCHTDQHQKDQRNVNAWKCLQRSGRNR